MTETRILLVDDERLLLRVLTELVRTRFPGCVVDACMSASAAMQLIADVDYDVILSDVRMPDKDGLELLREAHARRPHTSIVLMTGLDQHDIALKALRGGAFIHCLPRRITPESSLARARSKKRCDG